MPGRKSYTQDEFDQAKAALGAQVAAYRKLVKATTSDKAKKKVVQTIETFETLFFNNMVLVLDISICHRQRGLEGKDGNPLNEVRVLCTATSEDHGILARDKTIKMIPTKSISNYEVGDEIKLDARRFVQLSDAFFAEIEKKFG